MFRGRANDPVFTRRKKFSFIIRFGRGGGFGGGSSAGRDKPKNEIKNEIKSSFGKKARRITAKD